MGYNIDILPKKELHMSLQESMEIHAARGVPRSSEFRVGCRIPRLLGFDSVGRVPLTTITIIS